MSEHETTQEQPADPNQESNPEPESSQDSTTTTAPQEQPETTSTTSPGETTDENGVTLIPPIVIERPVEETGTKENFAEPKTTTTQEPTVEQATTTTEQATTTTSVTSQETVAIAEVKPVPTTTSNGIEASHMASLLSVPLLVAGAVKRLRHKK